MAKDPRTGILDEYMTGVPLCDRMLYHISWYNEKKDFMSSLERKCVSFNKIENREGNLVAKWSEFWESQQQLNYT